ncbi:MAG: PDZ domain-containing protein [Clostridia bacterium]|nr:PDZ domain-containing protein [Clostridia bacterium]
MSEELKNENEELTEASSQKNDEETISALFENQETEVPKKERKISLHTAIFAGIAVVLAAVMLTYTCLSGIYYQRLAKIQTSQSVTGDDKYYPFELFDQIFSQLSFAELDEQEMMEAALKAYVAATGDVYAAYYTAEEYAAMMASSEGKTQGIGINIAYNTIEYDGKVQDVVQIIHVTQGSPAAEAGLLAGDVIYAIGENGADGTVDALGYSTAIQKLQGEAGTKASFTILRKENGLWSEPISKSVLRREFTSDSVYGTISSSGKVGIVRIVGFDLTTPKQFSNEIDRLKAAGCESFVFDLRENPGGNLQSIEAILSYFLSEGDTLIRTVDKAGNEEVSTVKVVNYSGNMKDCSVSESDIGKYKDLKSVVLCNGATASAAELFTATFRDYELGEIVGTKTFGKGSMQNILSLSGYGYSGALKLTVAMYFSAKDTEGYNGVGISPDHTVELEGEKSFYVREEAEDDQLVFALGLLEND